jgi:hypothetical protein
MSTETMRIKDKLNLQAAMLTVGNIIQGHAFSAKFSFVTQTGYFYHPFTV